MKKVEFSLGIVAFVLVTLLAGLPIIGGAYYMIQILLGDVRPVYVIEYIIGGFTAAMYCMLIPVWIRLMQDMMYEDDEEIEA